MFYIFLIYAFFAALITAYVLKINFSLSFLIFIVFSSVLNFIHPALNFYIFFAAVIFLLYLIKKDARGLFKIPALNSEDKDFKNICIFSFILTSFTFFLPVLMPDTLHYHFPLLYKLRDGIFLKENIYSGTPFLFNYFFINFINNELYVKILYFLCVNMFVFSFYGLLKKLKLRSRYVYFFVILAVPYFLLSFLDFNTDLPYAVYLISAFYCFIIFIEQNEKKYIYFCAVFFGAACSVKYNGLFFIPLFLSGIIYVYYKRKILFKETALLLILFFVLASPFYIRNFLMFQDPFYPLGLSLKSYVYEIKDVYYYYYFQGKAFGGVSLNEFYKIFTDGRIFGRIGGPLSFILILIPFYLRKNKFYVIFTAYFFIAWIFLSPQTRFLLPAYFLLIGFLSALKFDKKKMVLFAAFFILSVTQTNIYLKQIDFFDKFFQKYSLSGSFLKIKSIIPNTDKDKKYLAVGFDANYYFMTEGADNVDFTAKYFDINLIDFDYYDFILIDSDFLNEVKFLKPERFLNELLNKTQNIKIYPGYITAETN